MNNTLDIEHGNAICYSGYRQDQSPQNGTFPSYAEVSEDLHILKEHWKFLRLYDCSQHAEVVLEVIQKQALDFKVMLGANMAAEVSNPGCPWGANFSEQELYQNQRGNGEEIKRLIDLANRYPQIVFSVSVGNEATVEWTDHLVPVENLITLVRHLK